MNESASESRALRLEPREAHVWNVRLDIAFHSVEPLSVCLSREEREHAAGLVTHDARRRYLVTRTALRHLLAAYAGQDAARLALRREQGGKPWLEAVDAPHFSLSHSRETTVIALATLPVGVDVEHVRPRRHLDRVARRVLHGETVAALDTLDGEARLRAFIDAWTQREAHVKAVGGGLFRTSDALPFDAGMAANANVHPLRSRTDGELWSVARFASEGGARGSIAVRGRIDVVRLLEWQPEPHAGDA